jgi:hypothetical protein
MPTIKGVKEMKKVSRKFFRIEIKKSVAILGLLFCSFFPLGAYVFSQTQPKEAAPLKESTLKVFIDCGMCDMDYLRKEIAFVDYVSERKEAQVYVLITSKKIESGAEEYTISFTGQNEFEGNNHTLNYSAEKTFSADEAKKGLANIIKMGLMRYVAKTPVSSRISINFTERVKPTSVVDKWNFWVFSLSAESFLSGEKTYDDGMVYGSFSANRVTPDLKIRLSLGGSFEKTEFRLEDSEVIKSSYQSQNFSGLVVKSINDHWSVGGFFSAYSSTYNNIKVGLYPAPALEYDLFPYSQSTKKQLRFLYRAGFNPVLYREETIYYKTSENLWKESLDIALELKQKWGTISTTLEGSHYFHNFRKNRLELYTEVSLRIFKGLNFNVYGDGARIHDQLFLPRSGASREDVLLQRRQLATSYSYYFSVGLSYTFGSILSKIVNPRFGGTSTGISITM